MKKIKTLLTLSLLSLSLTSCKEESLTPEFSLTITPYSDNTIFQGPYLKSKEDKTEVYQATINVKNITGKDVTVYNNKFTLDFENKTYTSVYLNKGDLSSAKIDGKYYMINTKEEMVISNQTDNKNEAVFIYFEVNPEGKDYTIKYDNNKLE